MSQEAGRMSGQARHIIEELRVPHRFGHTEHPTLGKWYANDTYLVLNKHDMLLYVEVFPEIAEFRFCPADFEKLEQDPGVAKLYSNGGLDIYFIHARASPA